MVSSHSLANADQPQSWRLQRDSSILDPTVPEVRALIKTDYGTFPQRGDMDLIKHDYSDLWRPYAVVGE